LAESMASCAPGPGAKALPGVTWS
jgi:hypothetical protein